jgi:putative ABC transport system substrate-binding protein
MAAWPLASYAQQPRSSLRRIGVLTPSSVQFEAQAFVRALQDRGYREGENLALVVVSAEGRLDDLPSLADQMARESFDVLVAVNSPPTRALLATRGSTPVVMAMVSDPIVLGFVENLSRPSGRFTGVLNVGHNLASKRLALLKEAVPAARRVAALFHPDDPITGPQIRELSEIAPSLGLEMSFLPVRDAADVERAFDDARANMPDAYFVVAGQSGTIAARLSELAILHRRPALVVLRSQVLQGGLVAYYADETEHWGRVADQVDRLLRGAAPSEIPIEQATRFNLVLNLRTARQIGLSIPPTLLALADEVIE